MNTYLLAIGWWNLVGSIVMLGFLYQSFGQKMLNEWTLMFKDKFILDYWGKLWFVWAAGLNIFFGLVNIMAVKWCLSPLIDCTKSEKQICNTKLGKDDKNKTIIYT